MPEMPTDGTMPEGGEMPEGGMGEQTGTSSVTYSAGQTLSLTDASGNVVWSWEAPIGGRSLIYAAAGLNEGETYTLSIAGTEAGTATATAGTANGGGFNPGGNGETPPTPPEGGDQPTNPDQPATSDQPATPDQPAETDTETLVYENDNWYVKYADGSYKTGWTWLNGDWYYLDPDNGGVMKTGWTYDGGQWYYLNVEHDGTFGKMLTGWVFVNGRWYYLNEASDGTQGAMARSRWVGSYYVGPDGAWVQ